MGCMMGVGDVAITNLIWNIMEQKGRFKKGSMQEHCETYCVTGTFQVLFRQTNVLLFVLPSNQKNLEKIGSQKEGN